MSLILEFFHPESYRRDLQISTAAKELFFRREISRQ